jgi:predicted ester cyclase
MTTLTNSALVRQFFAAQDLLSGGPDPTLCAAGYVARIGANAPMTLAEHQVFAAAFYRGFPDLRHTVEDAVADADKVAARFTLRGTHRGEFMGLVPTRKPIVVGAIAMFRVADGRIAELWAQFDELSMMRQLGVIA